jgi:hypothetical protein
VAALAGVKNGIPATAVKPTKVFLREGIPLPAQCATFTFHRAITVAEGVFAPGHLGELTQYIPFELVDDLLRQTRSMQQRLRLLPSRVGVYFVLALALFPELGYARVWDQLVASLRSLNPPRPSAKALCDLRRRVGAAPLKALFEVMATPLAQPMTPGVSYRRWRTVAFDGCNSLQAADRPSIRRLLGKISRHRGTEGYPHLRLMALCETGTRGLLGAAFGPASRGEVTYAHQLLHLLDARTLVLADRAFDSANLITGIAQRRSQLLIRLTSSRQPAVYAHLPDGTYLTRIGDHTFRIIEAHITATCKDGTRTHDTYRLITSLTDHRSDPAASLVRLYHERWEIESTFLALRHTLFHQRVFRSSDPAGLEQETWALLTVYQTLRRVMTDAIESRPGTDPDRASFTVALQAAICQVTTAHGIIEAPATGATTAIGQAVLQALLPPRRLRTSVRRVKCPLSRYHGPTKKPDPRPTTSQPIVNLTITVHTPGKPDLDTPRNGAPAAADAGRRNRALQLLRTDPHRDWAQQEIADALGVVSRQSLRAQLRRWTEQNLLDKTGRGRYRLNLAWLLPAQTPNLTSEEPS